MAQDYWKRLTQIATTPEPRNKPLKTESVGQMAQRAAGGAGNSNNQMADTSGTGVGLDIESKQTSLPLGFSQDSPTPVPSRIKVNPMGPEVGDKANKFISEQQAIRNEWNSKANEGPATPKLGAFDSQGNALGNRGQGTFNSYDPGNIVERARAFTEDRRARSPLRRQGQSGPTPFQMRKEQKARDKFRRDILARAGAGPGKDISLRAALGAIAEFEGQNLRAQAARRGQDIDAETADLNREQLARTAANRQRIQESLGQMEISERAANRMQDQAQFDAGQTQDQSQFEAKQQMTEREILGREQGQALDYAASVLTQEGQNQRNVQDNIFGLIKAQLGTGIEGEKFYGKAEQEEFLSILKSLEQLGRL